MPARFSELYGRLPNLDGSERHPCFVKSLSRRGHIVPELPGNPIQYSPTLVDSVINVKLTKCGRPCAEEVQLVGTAVALNARGSSTW